MDAATTDRAFQPLVLRFTGLIRGYVWYLEGLHFHHTLPQGLHLNQLCFVHLSSSLADTKAINLMYTMQCSADAYTNPAAWDTGSHELGSASGP